MEKLTRKFSILVILLIILFGLAPTASALQYGYAELNLDLLRITTSAPVATQYYGDYKSDYTLGQNELAATDCSN
jgi:hypothetical protein